MSSPTVSVIMPAFNAEKTLSAAMTSVLSQTYCNIRIFVVDDCSSDGTLIVARSFNDSRVTVLSNPRNMGVAESRNRALHEVRGWLVAFCDADDLWLEDKIRRQVEVIETVGCGVVHSYMQEVNDHLDTDRIRSGPLALTYDLLKVRNYIGLSSALVNIEILKETRFRSVFHEDYEFWLRNAADFDNVHRIPFAVCIPEVLCFYRVHSNNLTRNKVKSLLMHIRVQRRVGIGMSEVAILLFRNLAGRFLSALGNRNF